jgi:hypothetical protein
VIALTAAITNFPARSAASRRIRPQVRHFGRCDRRIATNMFAFVLERAVISAR